MNPMIPADRFWGKPLAMMALQQGFPAMNFEIVNGRWCVNLFCGFSEVDAAPNWKTIGVQQFYKEALLAEDYGLRVREKCRQYGIKQHRGLPCATG